MGRAKKKTAENCWRMTKWQMMMMMMVMVMMMRRHEEWQSKEARNHRKK